MYSQKMYSSAQLYREVDEFITPYNRSTFGRIRRIKQKLGIKTPYRARTLPKQDYERLQAATARHVEFYNSGLTMTEVAALCGVNHHLIKHATKKYHLGSKYILKKTIYSAIEVQFLVWLFTECPTHKKDYQYVKYHQAYKRMFGYRGKTKMIIQPA